QRRLGGRRHRRLSDALRADRRRARQGRQLRADGRRAQVEPVHRSGADRRSRRQDRRGDRRRGADLARRHARSGGSSRRRAREIRRRGGALAGLLVLRHVPELRASRPRLSRGGGGAVNGAAEKTERIKEPIVPPLPDASPPQQDQILFAAVLSLLAMGVVMVYSASAIYAQQKFGSPTYFLRRDLLWTALGVVAMTWAARTDFGTFRK